ncbi:hypothetical protein F4778DRAFT_348383 [Xylariomycetidae sp. FL2044]|nr:hypothetical protein F4778DRAFT_348383 [Xylariomycetidae sp. FL2044]
MSTKEEESLRRRRERGRRSQAGFRKRQAEQENKLKSAIERLVQSTRGDEHPELLNTIIDVAEAAGIHAEKPAQSNSVAPTTTGRSEEVLTIDATTRDIIHPSDDHLKSWSGLSSSGGPSERHTCGIWLDPTHYMRLSIPPNDILPYLGPGSKTFAGTLFWELLNHFQYGCNRKHTDTEVLVQRSLGHSKVTQYWTVSSIKAMIEARQEFRQTGSISPRYAPVSEPDLGDVVHEQIKADYHARGMDPDQWLSPASVEGRVRRAVGDEIFSALEAAARGEGDPVLRRGFEDIKCNLHETCVCFGDGPRWNVHAVDEIFLEWIQTAVRSFGQSTGTN